MGNKPVFTCDNCGKEFKPLRMAPHKRFCSGKCRNEWHLTRRKVAMARFREQEQDHNDQD